MATRTSNLPSSSTASELIANQRLDVDTVQTVRVPVDAVAQQMLGSGALANEVAALRAERVAGDNALAAAMTSNNLGATQATTPEAIAGTNATHWMSPAADKAALDARGIGSGDPSLGPAASSFGTAVALLSDASGNVLCWWDPAGVMHTGTLSLDAGTLTKGGADITADVATNIHGDLMLARDASGVVLWRVTSAGKFVADLDPTAITDLSGVPEMVAARGSRAALGDRLGAYLSPYGVPKQRFGCHLLRETRQRLMSRRLAEARQLKVAMIGDSYGHNATRWVGPVTSYLAAQFGDAGGGWLGFSDQSANGNTLNNGNARPTSYTYTRTGTWTTDTAYYTGGGPDLGAVLPTVAGARIVLTCPAAPVLSEVRIFWEDTSNGILRYSWDAGTTWTSINTQGTVGALNSAALSVGMPNGVAGTLWLERVSGTAKWYGVDFRSAASGVVVHKLAATGSTALQWATAAATANWRNGLALLAPNLVCVMLGVNDHQAARDPAAVAANIATILDQARVACPQADLLVMMQPEIQLATTIPMAQYTAAVADVVAQRDAAFVDLQPLFGLNSADYAYGSARPWMQSDQVHPDPLTGGRVLVDAFLDAILYP